MLGTDFNDRLYKNGPVTSYNQIYKRKNNSTPFLKTLYKNYNDIYNEFVLTDNIRKCIYINNDIQYNEKSNISIKCYKCLKNITITHKNLLELNICKCTSNTYNHINIPNNMIKDIDIPFFEKIKDTDTIKTILNYTNNIFYNSYFNIYMILSNDIYLNRKKKYKEYIKNNPKTIILIIPQHINKKYINSYISHKLNFKKKEIMFNMWIDLFINLNIKKWEYHYSNNDNIEIRNNCIYFPYDIKINPIKLCIALQLNSTHNIIKKMIHIHKKIMNIKI